MLMGIRMLVFNGLTALMLLMSGVASAMVIEFISYSFLGSIENTVSVGMTLRNPSSLVALYHINFSYNATVLDVMGVTFGGALGLPDVDTLTSVTEGDGILNANESSFLADLSTVQDGLSDQLLFTIGFEVIGARLSPLSMSGGLPGGGFAADPAFATVAVENVGTAAASAVPEPVGVGLLALGLLLVLVARRQ